MSYDPENDIHLGPDSTTVEAFGRTLTPKEADLAGMQLRHIAARAAENGRAAEFDTTHVATYWPFGAHSNCALGLCADGHVEQYRGRGNWVGASVDIQALATKAGRRAWGISQTGMWHLYDCSCSVYFVLSNIRLMPPEWRPEKLCQRSQKTLTKESTS